MNMQPPLPEQNKSVFTRLAAGAITAFLVKTSFAPIERIKLLYVTQTMFAHEQNVPYRKLIPTIKYIYQEGGIRGFFKGNLALLLKVMPNTAIKFTFFDLVKTIVPQKNRQSPLSSFFTSFSLASLSGATQTCLTYPLDLVRTRIMIDQGRYNGIIDCFVKTYQREGLRAFYQGLGLSVLATTFYSGFSLGVFDFSKARPHIFDIHGYTVPYTRFIVAMIAATIASVITFPIDLVRKRMQLKGSLSAPVIPFSSGFDCARQVFRNEGIRGLYRGVLLQVVRSAPGTALQLLTYDFVKARLGIT